MDTNETPATIEMDEESEDGTRGLGKPGITPHRRVGANNRLSSFVCRVEGCPCECAARGLCWKHYMRQRRYGSVSFGKRRYNMSPRCRYCGTTDVEAFYRQYKSICKRCRKLRAFIRQRDREKMKTTHLQTFSDKAAT